MMKKTRDIMHHQCQSFYFCKNDLNNHDISTHLSTLAIYM